jgi:hypothetical protein
LRSVRLILTAFFYRKERKGNAKETQSVDVY